MVRIAIIGNSGCGKSTLASALASYHGIPSLDLDSVAWIPGRVAEPRDLREATSLVKDFCSQNKSFLIEGCYEGLIEASLAFRPRLIFLDVGAEACERHCHARPFEPHKYADVTAQNEKFEFLLRWVRDYYTRQGPMSHAEHTKLFQAYAGPKSRYRTEVTMNLAGEIYENP